MKRLGILFLGLFLTTCVSTPPLIIKDSIAIAKSKPGDKTQIWSESQNRYFNYTFVRVSGLCMGKARQYTESYDCRCRTVTNKKHGISEEKCDTCYKHIKECKPHANLKCEPAGHPACKDGKIPINTLDIQCCTCQFDVESEDQYGVPLKKEDKNCEGNIDQIVQIRDEQPN